MPRGHLRPFILVIDASPTLRKVIEVMLSREGCVGISSADPMRALRDLKAGRFPPPDLAFVDVTLPTMQAYVCIGLLRSHPEWRHTTIIATADQGDVLTGLKARLAGAHVILTKPFTCQQLVVLVRKSILP